MTFSSVTRFVPIKFELLYKKVDLPPKDISMASLGEDLLGIVNKLQDLVFNTIGNDSLDLPQIVSPPQY